MATASVSADRSKHLMGEVQGLLTLKVRSREHHGRILRIRSPKCTIGSHPSCTLRLRATGVRPFHCVILRGVAGTFVRRWSGDTCLNGAGFKDTRLRPGDRLHIGPIELELLESTDDRESEPPFATNSANVSSGSIPSQPDALSPPSSNAASDRDVTTHSRCSHHGDSRPNVECKRHQGGGVCEECRQEREELETALALRAIQSDQHRSQLAEQCAALSGDLKKSEVIRKCLSRDSEKLTEQRIDEQAGYRELIESLRQELNELRVRHATQLTEQENLVVQAAAAQRQVTQLEGELKTLRRKASELEMEAERSSTGLATELEQREQELAASKQQLEQERQEAERLGQELQSVQQAVDTARQERDSARRELDVVRQKLEAARQQAEAASQEPSEQLQQLRQQLDEAAERLLASEDQGVDLQSQLEQLREQSQQALEADRLRAEEIQRRNDELEAAQTEHEAERKQWEDQWEDQWEQSELDEKQLREQLQEASEGLQEATQSLEAARVRSVELEQLLSETSHEFVHHEGADGTIQREKEESVREITKWRDLIDNARKELLQEREEHQHVRNEWHVERESVQKELAERSSSLEELQQKHSQEMEEAEFLILSLQQEGKQLLAQLDEARQAIRRDGDKHKRPEPSDPKQGNAADAMNQTMLMPSRLDDRLPPSEDGPEQLGPVEPKVLDLAATQAPEERSDATPSEMAQSEAAVVSEGEQTDDVAEQFVAERLEACRLNQTVVLQRDDPVDDAADDDAAEIEAGAADDSAAPHLDLQTLHLDPVELQRQAINWQVDEAKKVEVTEGIAALFAGAEIGQEHESESPDDEGIIQQYMERLLKRVASHGVDEVESTLTRVTSAPSKQGTSPSGGTVAGGTVAGISEADKSEVDEAVAAAIRSGAAAREARDQAVSDTPAADEQSLPSRAPRPKTEMALDLLAMRELANDSARDAIQSSEHRRFTALALGELTVASVCLVSAGSMIAMSPSKLSSPMAGGAIGMAFGSVMFLRGIQKFFSCRRLKRERNDTNSTQDGA